MDTNCSHAELVAALPALRPERDGGRVVERIVFGVLLVAGGISIVSVAMGGYGIGFGAFVLYFGGVALTPTWIHLRLWPRMALLSGDVARREELHLAGLTTPRHLWAAARLPVRRALLIPVGLWAAGTVTTIWGIILMGDRKALVIIFGIIGPLVVAFIPAFLGMAGAADVFGRLCLGMSRGQAVLLSFCWILAAMVGPFIAMWVSTRILAHGRSFVPIYETIMPVFMPILWLSIACMIMLSRVSFAIRAYCNADAA